MRLVSPLHASLTNPSIVDVARVVDELEHVRRGHPDLRECYILIEEAEATGAFMEAICVDDYPRWQVEVSNADEASLRALREPVTRGRAIELLCRFVQGDRSMGNGQEWMDVDQGAGRRRAVPAAFTVGLLAVLAAVLSLWLISR
jgi:hypothetical protein